MRKAALIGLVVLAGCGSEPLAAPEPLAVKPPSGKVAGGNKKLGLTWQVPANWRRAIRKPPGLFRLVSGGAEVSGWAWFRIERLPDDVAGVEAAKDSLLDQIRQRDPSFKLETAETREVSGLPALDVQGTQTIFGRPVRTRSVHIYKQPVEYVVEALAPPADFAKAADGVLEPLLESLKFGAPQDDA